MEHAKPFAVIGAVRTGGREAHRTSDHVACETPVGLSYNGVPYAVLMATAADLDDLAIGFSVTEGIAWPNEILRIAQIENAGGVSLDIELTPAALRTYLETKRTRTLRSFTSCGLCGVQMLPDLPRVMTRPAPAATFDLASLRAALASMQSHQIINRMTGATHAAAWVGGNGEILAVREDVGRHNALDKLIGALARDGSDFAAGLCLVTSRCSFEMVQKAAAAGMTGIAAMSAPTMLAIQTAQASGMVLIAFAREDTQMVYAGADRVSNLGACIC